MKKIKYFETIKRPVVTEKSSQISQEDPKAYLFEVAMNSTKEEIKEAIENLFDVKVDTVRTLIVRGKVKRVRRSMGKRSNWKKAYVTLQKGFQINFIEGV